MIFRSSKPNPQPGPASHRKVSSRAFLFDLVLYLPVMFLIREIYFQNFGIMINGLFWSFTTLIVATWRMRVRGITWAELGLCKPADMKRMLIATAFIPGMAIDSIQCLCLTELYDRYGHVSDRGM